MASDTDFVALYDELGLDPDCTLAQFKQAYRRRVGQLHPDVAGGPGDVARLQRLNRLYQAANAFHRRHGRLPGAAPGISSPRPLQADDRGTDHAGAPPASMHSPSDRLDAAAGDAATHPVQTPSRLRFAALIVVVAATVLLWLMLEGEEATPRPPPRETAAATRDTGGGPAPAHQVTIQVGMDTRQVLAIQGAPLNAYERRWDYGPSWVGFHCGRVDDWYSSPLRPLRVESDSPVKDGRWTRIRARACNRASIYGEHHIDDG